MNNNNTSAERSNPGKAYRDELENKGSTLNDTPEESDARDQAKIEKASNWPSQKIDGGNPHADEDTVSDEEIRRETIEKK